ncbi:hypothetical protein [Lysobacter sp. H23M47]|uniref:hypothetical protein n=1 Tax=Lysobacter sp. H23M47 TaxID=2781024 RepID=UPI0018827FD3|nr:hypothetical protein [Lysobacter sp. H23M47]QOW25519.1 hypothetical protein INQ43_05755 [Lysobacter sp. H23M47]
MKLQLRALLAQIVILAGGVAAYPLLAADRAGDADSSSCKVCERKAAELAQCQGIDADEYFTGLVFNPPGMQTGFARSSCFNRLALNYRDATLCVEVRERESMFFNGSALSRPACERRIRDAAAGDPRVVIADIRRLAGMQWYRNGNGRDFDVHVRSAGSYAHRYALRLAMLDEKGARTQTLWDREYGYRAEDNERTVLIRSEDLDAAAAALGVEPPYRVRLTMALVEPSLAELAQFSAMAPAERESSLEQLVDPGTLRRSH